MILGDKYPSTIKIGCEHQNKLWNAVHMCSITRVCACVSVTEVECVRHLTYDLQLVRCHLSFPAVYLSAKHCKALTATWLDFHATLILPTQVYKDGEKVPERRTERSGARAVSMTPLQNASDAVVMSCSEHDSVVGLVCYYCNFLWLTTVLRVCTHWHTNDQTPEMFLETW